jgi:hypothetical protein
MGMNRRLLAGFLWFLTGWYAGALLAEISGLSPVLAPVFGVAAAWLIVADPRRVIWTARAPHPAPPPAGLPDPA